MALMKLDIEGIYSSLQPVKPNFKPVKKELEGNDYLKLYGALAILWEHNKENFENYYCLENHSPIESAAICSDELCLWDFEGYELNERYALKSLYLNQYDIVMMSVYDNKKDRFIDFVA